MKIYSSMNCADEMCADGEHQEDRHIQQLTESVAEYDYVLAALGMQEMTDDPVERVKYFMAMERLLDWCAPRLKHDRYRETLRRYRANPPTSDHTPVVLSEDPS